MGQRFGAWTCLLLPPHHLGMAWSPTHPLSHSQVLLLALHPGNNQMESEGLGGPHSAVNFCPLRVCTLEHLGCSLAVTWLAGDQEILGEATLLPTPHPGV